jgi:hypothetical protein
VIPFHLHTSGRSFALPTATHIVVEVQDTPPRELPESGDGVVWTDHFSPSHLSIRPISSTPDALLP